MKLFAGRGTMNQKLPDVQKSKTGFPKYFIEKVGVEGIKVNMNIKTKNYDKQQVLATISSFCSLNKNIKGINMSRIARTIHKVLAEENTDDGFSDLEQFVIELKCAHKAKNIYIKANFDYIIDNLTPITEIYSPEYVNITVENIYENDEYRTLLTVKTTEMSLCPCSKEMSLLKNNLTLEELEQVNKLPKKLKDKILLSGFGAHNQKSIIQITVEMAKNDFFWIEDLVDIIRDSASAPTFSVLKRPDEKWVTEVAYMGGFWQNGEFKKVGGGPRFVEDITRQIIDKLNCALDKKIVDYIVKVNNQESIHSGDISAVSIITAGRRLTSNSYI